ncbi:unnamed protein product [Microthlaspi erraticum]|uniref:Uncharacterized protein n=1 Tax=Microthlaspi erraticum TaxID=1685480 RepID=A0A6D2JUS7_9BRAS|nr:unnamed protein product [Microthlaspi erraticum]
MASTHQFLLDDQTDEDFFDKLVDDAYSPSEAHALSSAQQLNFNDGSDSDDTRAFANLPVVEDCVGDGNGALNEVDRKNDVAIKGAIRSLGKEEPSSISLEDVQFLHTGANKFTDDVLKSEVDDMPLAETSKESNAIDGSGSPMVKEVDWGSFYADPSVNDVCGFGSYSDFFTELGGSTENLQGKAEIDVANVGNLVSNDTKNMGIGLDNSAGFEQHQGDVNHASASGQCVDNRQSWENLYPGWRLDAITGQWYQLDGHDASIISQEGYNNSTSNWESGASIETSDVAYLSQRTTHVVAGTAESVSTWNQVSQVSNGYPEHMLFDAQYPGWCYDTIVKEWLSLDSYNQASQTSGSGQAYGHHVENDHASMYNVNDERHIFKMQEVGMQSQQGS